MKDIPQSSIELFRKFINESSGFNLTKKNDSTIKVSILERLEEKKFENELQYYRYLKFHPLRDEEFKELITLITINETAFFRSAPHFLALREFVVPEIVKAKGNEKIINVWSAGCSTGEEAYSLAITLKEFSKLPPGWKINILATDIDKAALDKAAAGKYSARSLRLVSSGDLVRFFKKIDNNDYEICKEIKDMVKFEYFNLAKFPYPLPSSGSWDLIFCRNVIIYFDNITKAKVLSRFYNSLNYGGFLFLGFSETIRNLNDDFTMLSLADCYLYRKDLKTCKKKMEVKVIEEEKEDLNLAGAGCSELYNKALEYFYKENFKEAYGLCEQALKIKPDYKEAIFLKGRVLSDMGKLEEAVGAFAAYLEKDELSAPAYFFLGVIYQKLDMEEAALEAFKKSIYVDKDFAISSYKLAEAYEKMGDFKKALREYEYAVDSFKKNPEDEPLELAGGIKSQIFIQSCFKKIEELRTL